MHKGSKSLESQKEDVKKIAIDGALCVKQIAQETKGNFSFEYHKSFSGTEIDYALEVSNAVIDIFKPTQDKKFILNLPATVEMSLPHIYAQQVEFMSKKIFCIGKMCFYPCTRIMSRGCAVASAELGILAGADRIEGTLFGNGERTGNVDIITLALNLTTHGVDSKLDFSNLPHICDVYESVTKMQVYERQPYAGKLVFAAFSGSHQKRYC